MKNFVQTGKTIEMAAPYTRVSGAAALKGQIFGVAVDDVTSGASGNFMTEGVFDIAKDSSIFAVGDPVYWDDSAKACTSTGAGNQKIGSAVKAQLTGDATVRVRLDGISAVKIFQSSEQTGTGSSQNVAHGLGVVPQAVLVFPTDTSPSTAGVYVVTLGSHTSTNVVLTVTSGKKFIVVAFG